MLVVRPVMLVTDESCHCWYSNFQKDDIPSLRWHVSLNSPSSDFMKMWNVLTTEMLKKNSVSSLPLNYCWAHEGAVIICFTSGTTGRPKGVTLSHAALIIQSLSKIAIVGYGEDDVYLHTAPLCHIGGLSSAMTMLMVGGCHVLIPKFEPKSALEAIERHKVTSFITVPAIMAGIISLIRQKETWKGMETVNKILNGGGGLSIELIKDATLFFPRAKLLSAYGMTETCSSLTFTTIYDPTMKTYSQHHQTVANIKYTSVHQPQDIGEKFQQRQLTPAMRVGLTQVMLGPLMNMVMYGSLDEQKGKLKVEGRTFTLKRWRESCCNIQELLALSLWEFQMLT
ncbi:hypothetical protein ACJW31_05G139100 [Castanea mollissima]